MYINEVIEKVGITRKACLYYEEKDLIQPKYDSNGYRIYDDFDLERLIEIKLYRMLDLSILEIKEIFLSNIKEETLRKIYLKKKNKNDLEVEKLKLLKEMDGFNIDLINKKIENLEKNNTIKTRLLDKFPDFYSRLLFIHFNQFLDVVIETKEQRVAYYNIVKYLDSLNYEDIPYELYKEYEEVFEFWTDDRLIEVEENKQKLRQDSSEFLRQNKFNIKQYYEYINSSEYKDSNLYIINESISQIFKSREYQEIFIENLKVLSPEYKKYFDDMSNININIEKELFQ